MIDTGRNLRVRIMGLGLKNRMAVEVTAVSNTFIDTYMAAANGEYVKVFLYLLRHAQEELTIPKIADALNHTESDVKRALSYWEDAGLLLWEDTEPLSREEEPSMQTPSAQSPTMQGESDPGVLRQGRQETAPPQQEQSVTVPDAGDRNFPIFFMRFSSCWEKPLIIRNVNDLHTSMMCWKCRQIFWNIWWNTVQKIIIAAFIISRR